MIVRWGGHVVESRLGPLHVDQPLDATQVELIVRAIEKVGWGADHVSEVALDEGGGWVERVRYDGGRLARTITRWRHP